MDDLFSMAQMQSDMMQQQNMMMQQEMMMQQQEMLMQQQMMMQQSPNMMGMQPNMMNSQMGIYQQPIGTVDRFGFVKYSRQQYLDILRNYVITNCQVAISKEQPILETPDNLRHCCVESQFKITMLPKLWCYVPETNMSIAFYFCRDCGKLFYFKDFML